MRALSLGALFNFMNRQGYKEVEEEEEEEEGGGHKVVNYKTKHWKKREETPSRGRPLSTCFWGPPRLLR